MVRPLRTREILIPAFALGLIVGAAAAWGLMRPRGERSRSGNTARARSAERRTRAVTPAGGGTQGRSAPSSTGKNPAASPGAAASAREGYRPGAPELLLYELFRDGGKIGEAPVLTAEEKARLKKTLSCFAVGDAMLEYAMAGVRNDRGLFHASSGARVGMLLPPRIRVLGELVRRGIEAEPEKVADLVKWLGERHVERRKLEVRIFRRAWAAADALQREQPDRGKDVLGYVVRDGSVWLWKKGMDADLDAAYRKYLEMRARDEAELREAILRVGTPK